MNKEDLPGKIFLIPCSEWRWVWADDPAPDVNHDPADAVGYVKSECYDAARRLALSAYGDYEKHGALDSNDHKLSDAKIVLGIE